MEKMLFNNANNLKYVENVHHECTYQINNISILYIYT